VAACDPDPDADRAEIGAFLADGFVAVRGAVPAGIAAQCRDQIWSGLAAQGVRRDDPSTWTDPVRPIGCPEGGPFAAAGTAARLWPRYDQLIGAGRVEQAILAGLAQAGIGADEYRQPEPSART
jgi:hypothetical protein